VPTSGNPKDALTRARINFFVDTWFSKAGSFWFQILKAEASEEQEKLSSDFVAAVTKEVEPLLADASPFFGGSSKFTLAEALTAPFILRVYALTKHGLMPQSVVDGLDALPNFGKWAREVIKQESVTYIWDEEKNVTGMKNKIEKMKAAAKAN
jgi:glutathione S-transferase